MHLETLAGSLCTLSHTGRVVETNGKSYAKLEDRATGRFSNVSLDVFIGGTIYENKMSVNSKQGELRKL